MRLASITLMTIVRAHLVLAEQHVGNQRYHCVLSWDSTDPLYVELHFPDGTRWRFARGVWADGLTARTWGYQGDVLIEPLPDGDLHLWLRGELDDPDGDETVVERDYLTSRRIVARFVRDTHRYVPLGAEPLPVSADELLAELLD